MTDSTSHHSLFPIHIVVVATRKKGKRETHVLLSPVRRIDTPDPDCMRPHMSLWSVSLVTGDFEGRITKFFHKNCMDSHTNNGSDFIMLL